jgi:hypothetical protein
MSSLTTAMADWLWHLYGAKEQAPSSLPRKASKPSHQRAVLDSIALLLE